MLIKEIISEKRKKPSRSDCKRPNKELSAYDIAHCKCKGWKPREGDKKYPLSKKKGAKRVKVDGRRIKGAKCGGPLPDYGSGT